MPGNGVPPQRSGRATSAPKRGGTPSSGSADASQRDNIYTLIKPFPKISLELVTRMNALGSTDFKYTRRATA